MSEPSPTARLYATAFLYAAAVAALVLLVASLYYLVQNAHAGTDTRRLLIECVVPPQERVPPVEVTDPKVDCYTRSQAQQGVAVASIGSVSIVAAACGAAHPGDVTATRACVDKELAK